MKTIKLVNKQRVRIPGDSWANHLTFYVKKYEFDPEYSIDDFNEAGQTKFGILAFVSNSGVGIVSDYVGKEEDMKKDKNEYENAPLIEEGDRIVIDGIDHTFVAHIDGIKYCVPVSFTIQ